MFYSVASPDWKPGLPLTPAGSILFRTRAEAETFAPEAAVVAVAARFNPITRTVSGIAPESWSASAVGNQLGGVTVFGPIPTASVRPLGESRRQHEALMAESGGIGFHGWDSLTMALLA